MFVFFIANNKEFMCLIFGKLIHVVFLVDKDGGRHDAIPATSACINFKFSP
jgi:hypothetical protein